MGAGAGFQGVHEYDNAKLLSGARTTLNVIQLKNISCFCSYFAM